MPSLNAYKRNKDPLFGILRVIVIVTPLTRPTYDTWITSRRVNKATNTGGGRSRTFAP